MDSSRKNARELSDSGARECKKTKVETADTVALETRITIDLTLKERKEEKKIIIDLAGGSASELDEVDDTRVCVAAKKTVLSTAFAPKPIDKESQNISNPERESSDEIIPRKASGSFGTSPRSPAAGSVTHGPPQNTQPPQTLPALGISRAQWTEMEGKHAFGGMVSFCSFSFFWGGGYMYVYIVADIVGVDEWKYKCKYES